MPTVRQRRKTKNPSSKVRRSFAKRRERKKALPQSIPQVLHAHWDKTSTVRENYANLGLMRRLNGNASKKDDANELVSPDAADCDGIPVSIEVDLDEWNPELDGGLAAAQLQNKSHKLLSKHGAEQVRVDRVEGNAVEHVVVEEGTLEYDANGNVVGVQITKRRVPKQQQSQNVPVARTEEKPAIQELEAHAAKGNAQPRRQQHASEGEVRFVRECVEKYGQDFQAMSRDLTLNVWQWTPAQIRRKVEKVQRSMEMLQ